MGLFSSAPVTGTAVVVSLLPTVPPARGVELLLDVSPPDRSMFRTMVVHEFAPGGEPAVGQTLAVEIDTRRGTVTVPSALAPPPERVEQGGRMFDGLRRPGGGSSGESRIS